MKPGHWVSIRIEANGDRTVHRQTAIRIAGALGCGHQQMMAAIALELARLADPRLNFNASYFEIRIRRSGGNVWAGKSSAPCPRSNT